MVVGDVDDSAAGFMVEPLQLGAHIHTQLGVQVGKRLIQQQQTGLRHDGAGNGHTLLLAAGQLRGIAFGVLADLHALQSTLHHLLDLIGGGLADLQAEGHVLVHGHVGPQGVGLEHQVQIPLGRGRVVRLGGVTISLPSM